MSSFVNNFQVFHYFPQELKQKIKLFHVFRKNIAYCVTNDDNVYGLGENISEELGYHWFNETNDNNKSHLLIQELCDKSIEQFFGGCGVFFALSATEIYSWGWNGQLRNGLSTILCVKPATYEFFPQNNIIQIECVGYHCMALTSDGVVYGWGHNEEKQIDANSNESVFLKPIPFRKLIEKIKSIHCTPLDSYGMTFSGRIFCYNKHQYINFEIPGEVIIDLFYDSRGYLWCFQTNQSIYERKDEEWVKIDYKNPFEYFFFRYKTTYKSIHLKNNEMFSIDFCLSEDSKEVNKFMKQINFNETKLTISSTVFRDLPKTLKTGVKCFYKSFEFEFLVMNDNKVYVTGIDWRGKLAQGKIDKCPVLTEIEELSGKRIEGFFEGRDVMFARSDTNEIFSWGWNEEGLLGKEFKSFEFFKPGIIGFFTKIKIIEIDCGFKHCLALSSEGIVYGWGRNTEGQLGCDHNQVKCILIPAVIQFDIPIKLIHSFYDLSFAVDINGNAFYWGKRSKQIQLKPKKMSEEVIKLNNLSTDECIVLKESGKVFVYSFEENKIMREIIIGLKVTDIVWNLFETEDCVQQIDEKTGDLVKTNFINFYDYFSTKHNKTYKTIHVNSEETEGQVVKYLITKEIQFESHKNQLIFTDKHVFDRKFQKSLKAIRLIGSGRYGKVYEVMDKINSDLFAIKRVVMEG